MHTGGGEPAPQRSVSANRTPAQPKLLHCRQLIEVFNLTPMEDPLEGDGGGVNSHKKKSEPLKPRMTPLYFLLVFIFALSIATISFMAGKWSADTKSPSTSVDKDMMKTTTPASTTTLRGATGTLEVFETQSTTKIAPPKTEEVAEEGFWLVAEIVSTTAEPSSHPQTDGSNASTVTEEVPNAASELRTETAPTVSMNNTETATSSSVEDISTASSANPSTRNDATTTTDPTTTQFSSEEIYLKDNLIRTDDHTATTSISTRYQLTTTTMDPTTTLTSWASTDLTTSGYPTTDSHSTTEDFTSKTTDPTTTLTSWVEANNAVTTEGSTTTFASRTEDGPKGTTEPSTLMTTTTDPSTLMTTTTDPSALVTTTLTSLARDLITYSEPTSKTTGEEDTSTKTWEITSYPGDVHDPLWRTITREHHDASWRWPWGHRGSYHTGEQDSLRELLEARHEINNVLGLMRKFLVNTGGVFDDE
ncbi:hypothetical protein AAG570_011923 [Ranatra chinensis]|uniref:Uncharacterized protein n=1 Tax=Ranatra chinensis TaxID=642074 RepID=A0ABD0YHC3_9HEMI